MLRFLTIILVTIWASMPVLADSVTGPVLLTVSGNISSPNRDAADEFSDAFFSSHDVSFDKATVFDLASLEALGMKTVKVSYPEWPKKLTFEGPLLSDVLRTSGASGKTLIVRALDGYAPEIPTSEVYDYPVILALKADGKYLGIGDRGPAWVIFPRNDYPKLAEEDDSKYVWSVYHIEVMK